jgi:hypothetical protein
MTILCGYTGFGMFYTTTISAAACAAGQEQIYPGPRGVPGRGQQKAGALAAK